MISSQGTLEMIRNREEEDGDDTETFLLAHNDETEKEKNKRLKLWGKRREKQGKQVVPNAEDADGKKEARVEQFRKEKEEKLDNMQCYVMLLVPPNFSLPSLILFFLSWSLSHICTFIPRHLRERSKREERVSDRTWPPLSHNREW